MMDNLGKTIENSKLFPRTAKLLLAVSGGLDSMVLAHLLHSLKYNIALVHVNYRLRGNDSDLDAKVVKDYANENGIRVHILHLRRKLGKGNLQDRARKIRYAYFEKIRNDFNYEFILTAHHREDVLESFFYNLSRGAGLKGLKSIPKVNGIYVRPLLNIDKQSLYQYAMLHQVAYRDDKSNFTNEYERNFIRNEIIPLIESRFPSFRNMASRSINHLKSSYAFFESSFANWKALNINERNHEMHISYAGEADKVFIAHLLAEIHFHPETVFKIMDSLSVSGRKFNNNLGGVLVIDRNKLIYSTRINKNEYFKKITNKSRVLKIPHGSFSIQRGFATKDLILTDLKDQNKAIFDVQNLGFPLFLRNWQKGDRIKPFGLSGKSKKVQDVFTDCKLNIIEKSKVPMVCSGDQIIWIPGILRSNHYLVNEDTTSILTLRWNPA
ncbi:MAG: tRNA lysidine(34) synthetase TilS [Saprospiraceae bacterium]|nr:tRNA lysidine(34) synthetase TilS [Saprospiraceae bacterium]